MQALPRKPLRKGTKSCTECRRRKIRCYSEPDAPVCGPCLDRNLHCVDQRVAASLVGASKRPADEGSVSSGSTPRLAPRPRLAGPTATTQELRTPPSSDYPQSEASDIVIPGDDIDARVPFVAALNDAELLQDSPEKRMDTLRTPKLDSSSAKAACEALRSALPSYDVLLSTIITHGRWWQCYRDQAHHCPTLPQEDLESFIARTYTSKEPGAVGSLVTAYARSSGCHDLFPLVERLIVTNVSFVATIEGIKCLILLAKSYTDIGQPRKAWTLWRQGMMFAQLMGLYQTYKHNPDHQAIWWEIYQGDRLLSLMLGLPYGYQDVGLGDIVSRMKAQKWPTTLIMTISILMVAGKILDRNTSPEKPSFAASMKLEEELDALMDDAPHGWWSLPDRTRGPDVNIKDVRQRVLLQFYMFHIRIHIYLPFLSRRNPANEAETARIRCIQAARGLLSRLNILRNEADGPCLYECKTCDFIGFTAAAVLLISLANSPSECPRIRRALSPQDEAALSTFMNLLREQARGGDKVAKQCMTAICFLAGCPTLDEVYKESTEIKIPHFGTVVRKHLSLPFHARSACGPESPETEPSAAGAATAQILEAIQPGLDRDGIETPGSMTVLPSQGPPSWDGTNALEADFGSWLDSAMLDIDQDWVTFPEISFTA